MSEFDELISMLHLPSEYKQQLDVAAMIKGGFCGGSTCNRGVPPDFVLLAPPLFKVTCFIYWALSMIFTSKIMKPP